MLPVAAGDHQQHPPEKYRRQDAQHGAPQLAVAASRNRVEHKVQDAGNAATLATRCKYGLSKTRSSASDTPDDATFRDQS
jgi:hypothetical protein